MTNSLGKARLGAASCVGFSMSENDNRPHMFPRSRIEVIVFILRSCIGTKLGQELDIGFPRLGLYTGYLANAGLIEASKGKDGMKTFKTTLKGREFLRDYERIKGILTRQERMGP